MYLPAVVEGRGPVVVLCPGFGLAPGTYDPVARLVVENMTVLRPAVFRTSGPWDYDRVLEGLAAALDGIGATGPVSVIGHSFGGGIALGFAARWPERVGHLALVDSIGLSARWDLAREALVGTRLAPLLSPGAARDFVGSWLHSPRSVARAAWWAYSVDKMHEVADIIHEGVRTEVVWGADDSVLGADWGRRFARMVRARFTLVSAPSGLVEHTWVYRRPELFVQTMRDLGVLTPASSR